MVDSSGPERKQRGEQDQGILTAQFVFVNGAGKGARVVDHVMKRKKRKSWMRKMDDFVDARAQAALACLSRLQTQRTRRRLRGVGTN